MIRPASFWNFLADKYARDPVVDEASYQHKLAKSREYFTHESEILEIGSGTGSTAIWHAPFVKSVLATDISEKMIAISNAKLVNSDINNVVFKLSSIDDLNIEDESLDAVLALSVMHLIKNQDEVIYKIYKMLKPDGVFISSTVCLEDDSKIAKYIAPIGRLIGLILKPLTQKGLKQSLENAGFKIDYSWNPKGSSTTFIIGKK
ncbi:MAG: class I SAM-dependent methyltransferase [Alphaproteobacteria bacterium]|nr:class I SAM-dependent methyltransferase [Alphaproteobacteria bacterium]